MITASLPVQTSRATLFWPLSSTQLLCPRGCHSLWCEHHLEVLTYFLHIYVFSLRHREEYRPSQWWCVWECVWSVKYCSWWLSNVSASTWSLSLLWLSHASGKASLCCVPKEEEKWKIKHKTSFFTNLITVASGGDQSWISLLCTKACSIVCYTMPGIVRRSTAALLRESSQRVATMAIHMADLIAVRERSLPTVMLENRSCSRSSYLADGCWQPTQPLCASLLFLFHLIIFYFLFPTFPPTRRFVLFSLFPSLTPPPAFTPWRQECLKCSDFVDEFSSSPYCLWHNFLSDMHCRSPVSGSSHALFHHGPDSILFSFSTVSITLLLYPHPSFSNQCCHRRLKSSSKRSTLLPLPDLEKDSWSHWCYFKPVMHTFPPLPHHWELAATQQRKQGDMKDAFSFLQPDFLLLILTLKST